MKPQGEKKTTVKNKINHTQLVMDKYTAADWVCWQCPTGNINDFIAHAAKRLHYIRVVPAESAEDLKYHGESKNAFIQNAMSNSAVPVYAHVKVATDKNNVVSSTISLEDINTNARVVVAKKKVNASVSAKRKVGGDNVAVNES